ncbi:MAG: hypothetical protein HY868_22025 [Chloroflexi bacterium]|nr:hypothetical protein [Chloroflexota bacterium]
MPNENKSLDARENTRVTNAFLLGWAISETLGHLRKGARPTPPRAAVTDEYAPRLDASDGSIERAPDAFVFAAQRLAQFYLALGFETPDKASELTKTINALPQKTRNWLDRKEAAYYTQRELRDLLDEWSKQVWARLDSVSSASAQAFNAGLSLADTYWYMRLPKQRPKKTVAEESWQRLLSKYRLDVERTRLNALEKNLPRYVAPVIRWHLKWWSVGTALVYRENILMRDNKNKKSADLTERDEVNLQKALERQAQHWDVLLFGLRDPRTYLTSADHWYIAIIRRVGLFITLFFTAIAAIAVTGFIGMYLGGTKLNLVEWLSVINVLWTALLAIPIPLIVRQVFNATRAVQQWLDDTFTVWFIARRTHVAWDRFMPKPKSA